MAVHSWAQSAKWCPTIILLSPSLTNRNSWCWRWKCEPWGKMNEKQFPWWSYIAEIYQGWEYLWGSWPSSAPMLVSGEELWNWLTNQEVYAPLGPNPEQLEARGPQEVVHYTMKPFWRVEVGLRSVGSPLASTRSDPTGLKSNIPQKTQPPSRALRRETQPTEATSKSSQMAPFGEADSRTVHRTSRS